MFRRILALLLMMTLLVLPAIQVSAAQAASISTEKSEYVTGKNIKITFSGSAQVNDWIAIFRAEDEPSGSNYLAWAYANSGTAAAGSSAVSAGDVILKLTGRDGSTNLSAGSYKVCLLANNGYNILAASEVFTVKEESTGELKAPLSIDYTRTSTVKGCVEGNVTITPDGEPADYYRLYWGDENDDKLEGCSMIAEIEETEFSFNHAQFVPEGANRLLVYASDGKNESDNCASYEFTGDALLYESEFKYAFNVLSDIHLAADNGYYHNKHFEAALRDISKTSKDSAAIIIDGDEANNGAAIELANVGVIASKVRETMIVPEIILGTGNHDTWGYSDYADVIKKYKETSEGNARMLADNGGTLPYYTYELNGQRFVMLSGEKTENQVDPHGYADLSDTQIEWFKNILDNSDPSQPVYVFLHQPLKDTISGTLTALNPAVQVWHGVVQDTELREIIDSHPNIIMFTGHGHWDFNETQPSLTEDGKASYFNCPSSAYLWTDGDQYRDGSQGYFVEVYRDYVLIKGRDFYNAGTGNAQWVGCAQFIVAADNDITTTEPTRITTTASSTSSTSATDASSASSTGSSEITSSTDNSSSGESSTNPSNAGQTSSSSSASSDDKGSSDESADESPVTRDNLVISFIITVLAVAVLGLIVIRHKKASAI